MTSLAKVSGTGIVKLSQGLILRDVLLVPQLRCNILSISKLVKNLNRATHFNIDGCYFQYVESGKRIGSARICAGLWPTPAEEV